MRDELAQAIMEHGKTVTELADAMQVNQSTLSRVLAGRLRMTTEMAFRLDRCLGRGVRYWLTLQMERDIKNTAGTIDLANVRKLVDNRQDI